jgi:hypothetical protein
MPAEVATVRMSLPFLMIAVTNAVPSCSRTQFTSTGPTPGISHTSPGTSSPRFSVSFPTTTCTVTFAAVAFSADRARMNSATASAAYASFGSWSVPAL